jgi:LPXTG-motif cell wall-anchored protein
LRQTLGKGVVVAAAATSVLSLYGGRALADSGAHGAAQGSPGALSGNTVQVPVDVPVDVCGNSADVVAAALNPAFGTSCANAHGSTSNATPPPGGGDHTPPPGGGGRRRVPRSLPRTGGDAAVVIATSVAGVALIAAGIVLYRRGRAASRR